ncbi:MAG: biotin/lipoyl-containing protein [Planctomycetota bacterium]|jgi:biotin carboxyl carrier protein
MDMEFQVEVDGQQHAVRFHEKEGEYFVTFDGETHPVDATTPLRNRVQQAQVNGGVRTFGYKRGKENVQVVLDGVVFEAGVSDAQKVQFSQIAKRKGGGGKMAVKAPMPGIVVTVKVAVGDEVKKNQSLLTLHAMKLENDIRSPRDGIVQEVLIKPDDVLEKGHLMVKLGPLAD